MTDRPTSARLRIGEFARRTGLSRDTIRFYERSGLLEPVIERNGYRTFDERAVERAIAIQVAQGLGFSLAEIHGALDDWTASSLTAKDRLRFVEEKLTSISERIAKLSRMREYLEAKRAWIEAGEQGIPPSMVSALTGPERERPEPAQRRAAPSAISAGARRKR